MGMIFGKISVETPKFEILKTTSDYEIRKYPPCVAAQVTYAPSGGDRDGGFRLLAAYIGAFGQPQNAKPEKIAMTAPVITAVTTQTAATAPVVTTKSSADNSSMVTMQFILPSKYAGAEEAPKPTDERVVIREEGERVYGVVTFSGVARDEVVEEKVEKLKGWLERDGYEVAGEYLLARYNPPWTLPPLRTNQVMIPIKWVD